VRFSGASPLEAASIRSAIAAAEITLAGTGRLLIRKSGTEPLVRVMAEGEDEVLIGAIVDDLCAQIGLAAGVM
jgi:phosphoglucosamine mutase